MSLIIRILSSTEIYVKYYCSSGCPLAVDRPICFAVGNYQELAPEKLLKVSSLGRLNK